MFTNLFIYISSSITRRGVITKQNSMGSSFLEKCQIYFLEVLPMRLINFHSSKT